MEECESFGEVNNILCQHHAAHTVAIVFVRILRIVVKYTLNEDYSPLPCGC